MEIRCRNCGAVREIAKYHGTMLVTCPECEWQETLPARRHLSRKLDHGAGRAFAARMQRATEARHVLDHVASMTPRRFDRFCASMFAAAGYEVAFADEVHDEGHALELSAGVERVYVACRPGQQRVTVDDLERLAGSVRHDQAARGIVVTTGEFDDDCVPFAAEAGIDLVGADALHGRLMELPIDQVHAWAELEPSRTTE